MKKILLFALLLFAGMLNAQVVNIPDANFKNHLLDNEDVNTNGDDEIQVSEALAVTSLDIHEHPDLTGPFITLEGIEAFTNATYLNINTSASIIDLSSLTQLVDLNIHSDELVSLDLSGLGNLVTLFLYTNNLNSLDVSSLLSLSSASLDVDNLSSLDFSNLSNLAHIWCYGSNLTSLLIGDNPTLEHITLSDNSLTNFDLSGCPNIVSVHLTFDVENQDVFVNIKNGNTYHVPNSSAIYTDTGWDESPYKCFVCLDEGEAENFEFIDSAAVVSTYCTFTPGGDYNTISGTFYFDADNNGCGAGEELQGFASVHINDGTDLGTVYSSNSSYAFYVGSGTFTITPDFINGWFTATPSPAVINFPTVDNSTTVQDFCLTANGVHPDVEVAIIPFGAQPGFDASYKVIYQNKGNQVMAGDVVFTYNDNVLDYVSASPAEDASATGSLTWSYTNLQPFETREIDVVLNVNGPMETPAINIGDELGFLVNITPNANDETPPDNSFDLKQEVVGSFDPNDITCLEGDTVDPDMIGEYLHYNINFENTGDAAATFIVVKDIINEEQFDVSSLQMLYAAHDVEVRVEDNKVEFFFDAIDLGPLEKGNVTFKIKTLNTLQVNYNVMQQAEIFFDYNWPIETNEANTVFAILSSGGFELDATVKVYPNPAVDLVTIEAATALQSVQLYDVAGRLLQTALVNDTQASIDIASRAAGVYFVKITTEKGGKVEKIIKQ